MGTNYYAVKKESLEEFKDKVIKTINTANPVDLRYKIGTLFDESYPVIHIGKSSYGWKFLFDHNNWKFFEKTRDSINEFLKDCYIYDEYGEEVSLTEFWELVDYKVNGFDDTTYRSSDPIFNNFNSIIYDEYHDNLRFSKGVDFS